MGFLIKELLKHGLVHDDVRTVFGQGLQAYTVDARLGENGAVLREPSPEKSVDPKVLSSIETPFQANGGLKMLRGNLGKAVIKISAVKPERHIIEALKRSSSTASRSCRTLSRKASSTAISSPSCASRARRRTACRNCTS